MFRTEDPQETHLHGGDRAITAPLSPSSVCLSADLAVSHSVSFCHHQCSDISFCRSRVVLSGLRTPVHLCVVGSLFNVKNKNSLVGLGHNSSRHFSLICTLELC